MKKHTEEFKQEAVRIALTSGLPRRRVVSDLGVGLSTLGKWVSQYRPSDLVAAPQADLARENERLCLENRILKEEREILKKATQFFASPIFHIGAREVCVRGELASCVVRADDLPRDAGQPPWLSFMAHAADQPACSDGHESAGPYSGTVQP